MRDTVNRVIGLQQAATTDHNIINQLPDDFPIIIADLDKVTQIVENIISNAVRYSPEGGDIVVTGEDEDDTIRINITDHGLGIPEIHRDKIFQRFHVIDDESGHGAVKGTGIGLYLVQHLARVHGDKASVWLEQSEVGKGSTFSFRLPKEPQPDSGAE